MNALYVESSAILTWLLGEPDSERVISLINESEVSVSSVLSILETERALLRAEYQKIIKSADRQRLRGIFSDIISGWTFMEITDDIRVRASSPFPVEPIRTLDAIHLSSALEFLQIYPNLNILSFDRRIVDNLVPLGLDLAL